MYSNFSFDKKSFTKLRPSLIKGFEFKDFVEPSYISITLSELNDFDLYYDSLKDFGERKIKDLLFLKWYQTLNNILSIFPVCDSFYYYNKLVEFKEKIDKFFGWLFIITIVLLYPVFWLNGLVHNVRRMIDKNTTKSG